MPLRSASLALGLTLLLSVAGASAGQAHTQGPGARGLLSSGQDVSAILARASTGGAGVRSVTGEIVVAQQRAAGADHVVMAVHTASGALIAVDPDSVHSALGEVTSGSSVTLRVVDGGESPDRVVSGTVNDPAPRLAAEAEQKRIPERSGVGAGTSTGYRHQTYVVRVRVPGVAGTFSKARARQTLAAGSDFWQRESRGNLNGWSIAGSKKMKQPGACEAATREVWSLWQRAANEFPAVHFSAAPGAPTLVVFLPDGCRGVTGFTGLTTIGSGPRSGGFSLIVLGDQPTMAHELGHELGLGHANLELGDPVHSHPLEYGSLFSVMSLDYAQTAAPALGAVLQSMLGFVPHQQVTSLVSPGASTVTLAPVSATSGVRAATFLTRENGKAVRYAVEYRDGTGVDAESAYVGATPDHQLLPGTGLMFGPRVRVYRLDVSPTSGVATMTMTMPGTSPLAAGLTTGETYIDPSGGFRVSVVSMAATAQVTIERKTFAALRAKGHPVTRYGKKHRVVVRFDEQDATGKVTVKRGKKRLGRAKVHHGKAKVTVPRRLAAGKHRLRVRYSGNTQYFPEVSHVKLKVKKARAPLTLVKTKRLHRHRKALIKVRLKKVRKTAPKGRVKVKVGAHAVSGKIKVRRHHRRFRAVVHTRKLTKKGRVKVVFYPRSKNLAKKTYKVHAKVR